MVDADYRRSLTFMLDVRPRRQSVRIPSMHFYVNEIQQCQDMYARLQLDKPLTQSVPTTPFPVVRERSMNLTGRARPLTYTHGQQKATKTIRPYSIRSAPAFMFKEEQMLKNDQVVEQNEQKSGRTSTSYEYDDSGMERKRTKMDPNQLCDYLQDHGFGHPTVSQVSQKYRRLSQILPRGFKPRTLPKNPSHREKIKGRARLDQEMANMKALAFCEQQAPRVFRTASANMKDRDVQFVEDEMREHIHREDLNDGDDNASIVMMPMTQEELFERIDTWLEGVESACRTSTALA